MNVIENDFADKADMLRKLEDIRERVESGEITGFEITSVCQQGQAYLTHSVWWAQKTALLGAMTTHQFGLNAELQADKLRKEMDKLVYYSTPSGKQDVFFSSFSNPDSWEPEWFGVDWGKDSGMIRGDVINRQDNVIFVRFKTVELKL